MKIKNHLLLSLCLTVLSCSAQVAIQDPIRLNQIGFYPNAPKIAVVYTSNQDEFMLMDEKRSKTLWKGKLNAPVKSPFSDRYTRLADFSTFTTPGKFVLVVPDLANSASVVIRENVHDEITKASVKAFYFHRLSTPLPEKFAGQWKRKAGHPDNKVYVHASATSAKRPENTVISSPRGWYDAGDYNKYIVNSGITMGTMLSAYEDFPQYWNNARLDIPESDNEVPDLLDEVLWNLRWMLTMQDPEDGGVYHKLTNSNFDGMVMPHDATAKRFVVQKGTAATLDFVAVTAQSARVYKAYEKQFPGLADSCLNASRKAWSWAEKNPAVMYNQDQLNKSFDPDVVTGTYGDNDVKDEFIWAAAELLITTGDRELVKNVNLIPDATTPLPAWPQVKLLSYYSLVRHEKTMDPSSVDFQKIKRMLLTFADGLISGVDNHYMKTIMGRSVKDYSWGSSSVAANQSIVLLQAYKISGERKYADYALSNVDYLMGRNGTGYCFVTGFGAKRVMHPHHRPSEADGVADPVPGWLSGGPNPAMQDRCQYASSIADEAFTDNVCSYASNEVAINWNAPLVYVLSAFETLQKQIKY
jgi:endoglucanase